MSLPGPSRAGGSTPAQRTLPAPGARPQTVARRPASAPVGAAVGGNSIGNHHFGHHQFGHQQGFVSGSGLVVNGSVSDDNFNLAFHLGAQPAHDLPCHEWPVGTKWCQPSWGWYYPSYWWDYPRYYDGYYDNSYQQYAVIDGALVVQVPVATPAPVQPPAPAAPPPTDAEVAAALLKSGDSSGAIDLYRKHLQDRDDDAEAMRGLGVALLVHGEPEQGVAMISMAYRTNAMLVDAEVSSGDLFKSQGQLRETLRGAVSFANKIKSASAWLTVAVLMQAEGRDGDALRMIDRAADLGLDAALVKRFRTALGG
jgi:hypothetical protein